MQNLKTLDSLGLHDATIEAATTEKRATLYLLECLHWVEVRKIYLERGYPNLFQYVTGALRYSESQASERIRAMRLAFRIEAIRESLEEGSLTLTSAAKVASVVRNAGWSPAQVIEILPQIQNKTSQQVDQVLATLAPEQPKFERVCPLGRELSELRVTLDAETLQLLEDARDLDANPGVAIADLLKRALAQYVDKKRSQKQSLLRKASAKTGVNYPATAETAVGDRTVQEAPPRSRHIPRPLRREVWARAAGKCEYTDPHTGRRCAATRALTYEHKTPYAHGGAHSRENLTLFCAAHNHYMGEKIFGERRRP